MTTKTPPLSLRAYHRSFLLSVILGCVLSAAVIMAASEPIYGGGRIIVDARIPMTCFPAPPPPPGIGDPPPCPEPTGLDPRFSSPSPSGEARVIVRENDTTKVVIKLDGLAPDLVVTAWLAYYFPPGPTPDPIFDGLAAVSVPLAPTDAGFTEGLGPEPNQFWLRGNGDRVRGRLVVELDYNPLKAGQGPLRNEASLVDQAAASPGSSAQQPLCCPNGSQRQPIGASFLRAFDLDNGYQMLDSDGRPILLRSPVPAVVIAVVVHIDDTTHGISAGTPIPPIPGIPADVGDHFTLGLFDLRAFHLDF